MFVGVDVGGTKTAVLVTDERRSELAQLVRPTRLDGVIAGIIESIEAAVRRTERPLNDIQGIGIAFPGMVDAAEGDVLLAVNLNISSRLPLADKIRAKFGVPVLVENDVRLAAFGVHQKLGKENLAYLSIGTGIAAGLVLGGVVYHGANHLAGEIGYVSVPGHDVILEHLIAGPAIVQQAIQVGLSATHAGEVYAQAEAGELRAVEVIDRVSSLIAWTIQWLIMAYDVELVVLGGGVTAGRDRFMRPILHHLARLRNGSDLSKVMLSDDKVHLLESGFNAGLWGGVYLAQKGVGDTDGRS